MKSNRQARQLLNMGRWVSNIQKVVIKKGQTTNQVIRTGRKKKK